MIPRLTAGGASFKGAALYYLADKREPGEDVRTTTERVAWTETVNLPTGDPQRAWRMMAHTASSQAALKQAAGVKATGRKLTRPVMAYSLAWSPDEAEPSKAEMIEAARDSLVALGLDGHQALIVCHNDTAHPHVHVIVNRVNPGNGIAHKGSKTKLVLSAWAEAYERERGQILCVERVENNAARRLDQKPDRKPKVARNHWQAARADPARAAEIAATYAEAFADLAAAEREAAERRDGEYLAFAARRKAGREAIRARYQAAVEQSRRPDLAATHARLADSLLSEDPAIGLAGLVRDRSTFTRADLVRHVGRHTASVEAFQAVLSRLQSSPELVAVGRDERGRTRYTTKEHQAIERRMLDRAVAMHAREGQAVRPLWPRGAALSQDQNAALRHVVQPKKLALIVGIAGTGKSTMMGAARRSWEAAGLRVRGMALSGIAADSLKSGSGINAQTIHRTLRQWESGKDLPTAKDVIVLDEAGMVGSRQLERVMAFAEAGGAKLVLLGDPEQLQAIEAGGAFRLLADRFGAAEISTVRRQRVDWQADATRELATARTGDALARYERAGMVHHHRTQDEAKAAVIASWRQAAVERPRATQIILAYTRADVRDLNTRARAMRREAGELGPDRVLETAAGKKAFAPGDRIYFLKNDTGLGVRNGSLATVMRIERQTMIVRLDGEDGRQVMFGMANYNDIDHGYAATIHKSQGVTVDQAHLLAGRNLDRHSTYVALSRHRDRVDLHWSGEAFANRATLVRRLSRVATKDTTLDYEAEPSEPVRVRPKQAKDATKPGRTPVPDRAGPPAPDRPAAPGQRMPDPPVPVSAASAPATPMSSPPVPSGLPSSAPKPAAPTDAKTERTASLGTMLDRIRRRLDSTFTTKPRPASRPGPTPAARTPEPSPAPSATGQDALSRLWQSIRDRRSPGVPAKEESVRPAPHGEDVRPAPPLDPLQKLAVNRAEMRQRQKDEAVIRQAADAPPPAPLEQPLLPAPEPVAITVTFELTEYDREMTARLQDLLVRHEAEREAEDIDRATLRVAAAAEWDAAFGAPGDAPWDAPGSPGPDDRDREPPPLWPERRGPRPA